MHTILVTMSSAWVGFGFARLAAPGKKAMFSILLGSMMLPGVVTLIPTYLLFAKAHLVNTYIPWVLWGLAGAPFLIFLFRQFFANIPRELEEAAVVDGCGYTRIFWRIFLPQSWPVLATSLVLSFTWDWGDYIGPALLLSPDRTTLAVALMGGGYTNEHGNPLNNLLAAGAVMYVVPVLLLFLVVQRGFVSGFSTSGLK
jgi:multiple sugar transport system permease protein